MRLIRNFILLVSVVFYSSSLCASYVDIRVVEGGGKTASQNAFAACNAAYPGSSNCGSNSNTTYYRWSTYTSTAYNPPKDGESGSHDCHTNQYHTQNCVTYRYYISASCPPGMSPDGEYKCVSIDSDGDGVPDGQDSCPNDPDPACVCPPNHTTINGRCEANVWCSGPPKGYIAANMICPAPASPHTPDSQSEAAKQGVDAGAGAGASAGAEAASSGATAEEAAKAGGAAGAAAGAQKSAASGGATAAQSEAIGAAVHEAMQTDPSAAKAMAVAEKEALAQGLSAAEANQAGIAAAAGYEAGLSAGNQAYAAVSNGANVIATADCVDGLCEYTQTFQCPSGTSPRRVGADLICRPNPVKPACDAGSLAACDIPDCQSGVWNGSFCESEIKLSACPSGFTAGPDKVCKRSPVGAVTGEDGLPSATSCPAGYTFTGSSCIQMITSTSTTVTTNSDGTTTTTTTYNSSSGSGQGQGQQQDQDSGAGECDPESKDYAQCVGQLEEVSDTAEQDVISALNAAAESALNDFESDYIDELSGSSNVLDVATGLLTDPIKSLLPQSSACDSSAITMVFSRVTVSLNCARLNQFKNLFGWALNLLTAWTLFSIALSPVQSKV